MDIMQRVACKAIIVKDGKVLVLREASTYDEGTNIGKYDIPGGRINPGEPFKEGLAREVLEETGLNIIIGEPLYIGEWFPEIKGVKNHIVAIFFTCTPLSDTVMLSEDHDDYCWVSLEEAEKLTISQPGIDVIRGYFKKVENGTI